MLLRFVALFSIIYSIIMHLKHSKVSRFGHTIEEINHQLYVRKQHTRHHSKKHGHKHKHHRKHHHSSSTPSHHSYHSHHSSHVTHHSNREDHEHVAILQINKN